MSSGIVEYVDPNTLHRDVNQPRQPDWDSPEVVEELQKLADSYHGDPENQIWQIKIDENNTVRLGERRWRAALLVGLDLVKVEKISGLSELEWFRLQTEDDEYKVLHGELDKAWAYGLRVVQINSNDESITLNQLKEMDQVEILNLISRTGEKNPGTDEQAEGGIAQLVRSLEPNPKKRSGRQRTIGDYTKVLYLEPETQMKIGRRNGKIPYTYARVVVRLYPDHPKEKSKVEQMLRDNKFKTREQLEVYIDTYFEELSKQAEERAEELEKEDPKPKKEKPKDEKPEEKEPEEELPKPTPEKEVIESEAERIRREKTEAKEKVLKSLYIDPGKGNSLEGKISSAEELGVDEGLILQWRNKFTEFDLQIKDTDLTKDEYNNYYTDIREIINEIDSKKKEKKTEIDRQKLEEAEKERLREEVKEELMEDKKFREEVATEHAQEGFEAGGEVVIDPIFAEMGKTLTPAELEELKEYHEHTRSILSSQVVKKRGNLFANWWNHATIIGMIEMLTCPECDSPSGNLRWDCHDLSFEDAVEIARARYESSLEEE